MALTFKSIGKKIGGVLKKAAPAAMFIPGIGPIAAAGIGLAAGAGGSVLEGKNLKSHLKHGAIGGVGAGVGKYGLSKLASRIPGRIPGPGEIGAKAGKTGGGSLLGRAGSLLRGGAGFVAGQGGIGGGGRIGLADLLMGGLTAAGGAKSYKDSAEARKRESGLTDRQLAIADEQAGMGRELFAGARPARIAAQIALENRLKKGARQPTDYARFTDTANPFAKNFAAPAAVAPPTPPAPRATARVLPPPVPRPMVEPRLALPNPRKRKLLTAGAAL